MRELTGLAENDPIPFEVFAGFERLESVNPIIACEPPEWAAAAHVFVMDDTVHYLWGRRKEGNYWVLMHSTAPVNDPAKIEHDLAIPCFCLRERGLMIIQSNILSHFGIPPTAGSMFIIWGGDKSRRNRRVYWWEMAILASGRAFP